jgi:hypothetical protein
MNLDGLLREGSLTDLTWYKNGLKQPGEITFHPESKNPNNVKPEAQNQWGYGDISPIFEEDIAGTVDRHIPEKDLGDVAPVVVFARNLMNQGAPALIVDREIKAKFTKDQMRQGLRGLRELFAMDGIIGRIAIDARGYESCELAKTAADRSPYKRHLKFVIGCSCGTPHMVPASAGDMELVASTGNVADDFLAMDETPYETKEIPYCRSTMMPLYASVDDLDPSGVNDLMVVVENVSGVPGDEAARLRMLDEKPIKKAQEIFRAIDKAAATQERRRYSEPVDASEFMMDSAENEIELFAETLPPLDVDSSAGDFMGQGIPSILAEIDEVDMTLDSQGTIFEGSDIIELDEIREAEAPLDIEMDESEISW